jgi:hypothetical protein
MSSPVVEPLDPAALRRFADVELLLVDWLLAALGGPLNLKVSTEVPPGDELAAVLAEYAGYVHVEAFGGADKNAAQDVARVDVDVYVPPDADGNPNRGAASDLAELIRAALLFNLPGFYTDTATISSVATVSRPTARPYDDDSTLRKFGAAYQIEIKSRG